MILTERNYFCHHDVPCSFVIMMSSSKNTIMLVCITCSLMFALGIVYIVNYIKSKDQKVPIHDCEFIVLVK